MGVYELSQQKKLPCLNTRFFLHLKRASFVRTRLYSQ